MGDSGIRHAALDEEEAALPKRPTPPPSTPAQPKRVALPPEPSNRIVIWSGVFLCVAVSLLPLMALMFSGAEVVKSEEAQMLLRSEETWQRMTSEREPDRMAWMLPSLHGRPSLDPPPFITWLHLIAWSDLEAETASPDRLAWRARWATVVMGLITVMATYWAGMSIGGARVARFAAMCLGTLILFVDNAAMAAPLSVALGWTALAVAAGLWAMRPLKPIAWVGRRVLGWLIAGMAMSAAILTLGPVALLQVLPPLVAAIILTRFRRTDNTIGLLFAVMVALVAAAPWYLNALDRVPGAREQLMQDWPLQNQLFVLSASHVRFALLILPWLIWLIGALCQPFLQAESEHRRQLLIAWFWFVLLFVIQSVPGAEHPRALLPVLPAVALMVGQLWAYHVRLASERQENSGANLLRAPHWLLLGLASIFGPLLIAVQPQLVEAGYLDQIELPGLPYWAAAMLAAVLLLITVTGLRWHMKWRVRLSVYATVAWMLVAMTVGFWSHGRSDRHHSAARSEAQRVMDQTGDRHLAYLETDVIDSAPHPAFSWYTRQRIVPMPSDRLATLASEGEPVDVVALSRSTDEQLLAKHGFRKILTFNDGHASRGLWRASPLPAKPAKEN